MAKGAYGGKKHGTTSGSGTKASPKPSKPNPKLKGK